MFLRLCVASAGVLALAVTPLSVEALENGQPATYVLGQNGGLTGTITPIFAKGTANNAAHKLGINTPILGLALDSTDHRLFVSDTNNHRVLVYNLDVSNALIDRVPDNVLGQLFFWSNTAAITQAGMSTPCGLAYDDANNRLFVTQSLSTTVARVTAYDVTTIVDGENAINVLGQSSFTVGTAATTQVGLNLPYDVAYDSVNQRLFVSQATANRVTVFNLADGLSDGEAAVSVLGQANFTTATAATTQAGMNVPYGLAYDSANQRLFVAQLTGNRVTVYDVAAITDGENATGVLGQANFTATTAAITQAGMNQPIGVAYDSTDGILYVAQGSGNRVTTYDVAVVTNGENAVNVLGQSNFTNGSAATSQSGLSNVAGVLIDEANSRLYVLPNGSHRVVIFDVASITNGENAVDLIGQYDDNLASPGPVYTKGGINNAPHQLGMSAPQGVAVDATNNRLFVADSTNNRILVFNLDASHAPVDMVPDGVLGQVNYYTNAVATTQAGLSSPVALAFDEARNLLFASDVTNNRVLVYDVASITNGEAAVNVIGQVNFTTATATVTQFGLSAPRQLAYDASTKLLYVAESGNNRVSVFDLTVISDGETAVNVLGQDDGLVGTPSPIYTKGAANNGPHKLGLSGVNTGIALDATDHRLFVSDTTNNRVLVYGLNGSNVLLDRVPDNVLGQVNFWTSTAASTQVGFNVPYGLAFDDANNRLFVAEGTSNRVKTYDVTTITDGEDAINVLGQVSFAAITAATTQVGMSLPIDLAYDATNGRLFVAEFTNNRVKVYNITAQNLPVGMNGASALGQTDSDLSAPLPIFTKAAAHNGTHKLGISAPIIGVALDVAGHRLFLSDTTNNRVLVYGLNGSNALVDRIPDNVLGQVNFHTNGAGATQGGLETPNGLALSGSTVLFVAEGAGSRVKLYDVTSITDGEDAINVLGQVNFTGTTAATTQGGMSAPTDVLYDGANKRLFVADSTLNRVTTYDLTTITTGENAVNVLGQANFTSATAATTQTGMNVPYGLAYDGAGQRLFVSEGTSNRVKVYDVAAITDNESATGVLGQANFTTATAANTQAGMNGPRGLYYHPAGQTLYVAQTTNNRVTTYDVAAVTNGENAVKVLGQVNFTATAAANTQAGMNAPNGVLLDEANNWLYVPQSGSSRVSVFDVAAITDGENAVDLLGQYDDSLSAPAPVFTKSVANNGPNILGMSAPVIGVALDPTDHRLFVSDTGNNRILVYNLDSNDLPLDMIPDAVLGQANFYTNAAANTQAGLNVPNGLAFDDTNNRLFVAEGSGNRVKSFDVAAITNGENAVNVLGQANFTSATAATTQTGMNVPFDVAYDTAGQRLFVAEGTSNRVKVYDVAAITDNENATGVLGQADFVTATAATTAAGMNGPRGVAFGSSSRLYVSQTTANRVTVYDVAVVTNGESAINVLGQANFTTATAATTQAGMNDPRGIAFDATNNRLWVSQVTGNRITAYDVAAITDGENAITVFGQPNYTTLTAGTTRFNLSAPTGVLADPAHSRLFTLESTNNRLLYYDLTVKIGNGMDANFVLGQANFTTATPATTAAGMNVPRGLAYDASNQRLYVSQSTGNRVTTYDVAAITNGENAVNVLGQATMTATAAATTQAGMSAPAGMCLNAANSRLFVADATNNRIKVYDVAAITDNENAINVLGQPDFTTATAGIRQSGLSGPNGCLVDDNSKLYVLQNTSNRVSIFDVTSISNGGNAVDLFGQTDNDLNPPGPVYIKGTANNASYKMGLSAPNGVAVDPVNHRLFVADTTNNRVLVYGLNGSNYLADRVPDNVLGQPNYWLNTVATTQAGLSSPVSLAFNAAANHLYVTDLTNNRILTYDTATIEDGEYAIAAIGQPFFTVATAGVTQLGLSGPRNIHYDAASGNLYVADGTNNRAIIYGADEVAVSGGGGDSFHFFGF